MKQINTGFETIGGKMNKLPKVFDLMGKEVIDRITGFKGIVTGICHYLTGCVMIGVQPKLNKDGKLDRDEWFAVSRIKVISSGFSKGYMEGK